MTPASLRLPLMTRPRPRDHNPLAEKHLSGTFRQGFRLEQTRTPPSHASVDFFLTVWKNKALFHSLVGMRLKCTG